MIDQISKQINHIDVAQLRQAIDLFSDPAGLVFLTGFPSRRCACYDSRATDHILSFVAKIANDRGSYFCINPVNWTEQHAKNADIIKRRWLFVDIDRNKTIQADDPSTDTEHEAAMALANDITAYLIKAGWGGPIKVDSGNGCHLYWRIDLPNDEASKALVRAVLELLDSTFSDERGAVGSECYDARRLSRLPGTWSRRGAESAERPYRMCKIINVPDKIEVVPAEMLTALVGEVVKPAKKEARKPLSATATNGKSESARKQPYARKAISEETALVAASKKGDRHDQLNRSAFALFQLVGGGVANEEEVWDSLWNAAVQTGYPESEIASTMESARRDGLANPRTMPESREQRQQPSEPRPDTTAPTMPSGASNTPADAMDDGADADDYAGGDDGDGGDVSPPARNAKSHRAEIIIGTAEHAVNDAAIEALATDTTIYQRGGILVRVLRDGSQTTSGIRRDHSAYIDALPSPILRDRLTAVIEWQSIRQKGDTEIIVPAHPPGWCVSALHARGHWPGIRHLEAVLDYPVLRPDGTILSAPGYDGETGLLMDCHCEVSVPDQPTHDDAIRARDLLLSVVADFPFAMPIHQSAWMAALLTPLSRFAYHGPAPLFLVDANVRGSGKGLLLDSISRIITGGRFVIAAYTQDEDEMRKRITSLAVSGERLVLFDNLDGNFGNGTLDAALTGTSWTDRLLGVNKMARCPLFATWYATGNNVQIHADTARRICHIRLDSPMERPEERSGFQHGDLLGYIGEHRAELLSAALTILRAYVVAGRPDQSLPAWGSFDAWSRIVRAAIVWAGMPDPGETRTKLQESADTTAESMGQLLVFLERLDTTGKGMTAGELIDKLRAVGVGAPNPDIAGCRAAVESLIGKLDSRALGYRLRRYRRRIFGERYIDRAGESHNTTQWRVYPASSFHSPGLGEDISPISPDEY